MASSTMATRGDTAPMALTGRPGGYRSSGLRSAAELRAGGRCRCSSHWSCWGGAPPPHLHMHGVESTLSPASAIHAAALRERWGITASGWRQRARFGRKTDRSGDRGLRGFFRGSTWTLGALSGQRDRVRGERQRLAASVRAAVPASPSYDFLSRSTRKGVVEDDCQMRSLLAV